MTVTTNKKLSLKGFRWERKWEEKAGCFLFIIWNICSGLQVQGSTEFCSCKWLMLSESQKASIQVGSGKGEGQMLTLQIICLISNSEAWKSGQDCFGRMACSWDFSGNQHCSSFDHLDREVAQLKEDKKFQSLVINNSSEAPVCPSVGYEYFHSCVLVNFQGDKG